MVNYTKFIYQHLSSKPSQAPGQSVNQNLQSLGVKARKRIETKKQRAERLKKNEDELSNYWWKNGKRFESKDDGFIYETLTFKKKVIAKEAFLLLSLVKKYWSKSKAKDLYDKSWKGNLFYLDTLRKFFSDNEAKTELGVYWNIKKHVWTVYDNRTKVNDVPVGLYLHLNWGKVKAGLKKPGVEYLVGSNRRTEVSSFIETQTKNIEMSDKDRTKKVIVWANKEAVGKWQALPDEIRHYMHTMYGKRTGYYVYRYNPSKKRLYAMRIESSNLQATDGTAAYMDVKNGEFGNWEGYRDGDKFLEKEFIGEMSPVDIEKELLDFKGKEAPGSLSKTQKLLRTSGMISKLSGIPSRFSYSKLNKDYLEPIEGKLIKKLKLTIGVSLAKEFAKLRVKELKDSITKYIDSKPDTLKKAIEDKPDIKLNVSIDSDDKVEVKFSKIGDRIKYKGLAKEAKKLAGGAGLKGLIDQKSDELTKGLGPLAGFLKWFDIDLKNDVEKYYKTGKKSIFLTIAGMFASVDIGRRIIRGKNIKSIKDLEKLAKKNNGILSKDYRFKKEVVLSGYQIVIKKGKNMGIKPGSPFTIDVKGEGSVLASPAKKKKQKGGVSFLSLFGSKKSNKFVLEDKDITITNGTKIPNGTVIPKGAKIEKV